MCFHLSQELLTTLSFYFLLPLSLGSEGFRYMPKYERLYQGLGHISKGKEL